MEAKNPLVKLLVDCGALIELPDPSIYSSERCGPVKALANAKLLNEVSATRKMAEKLGIKFLRIDDKTTLARYTPGKFQGLINKDFYRAHKLLPLIEESNKIIVGCLDPFNQEGKKSLEFILGKPVELGLVLESALDAVASFVIGTNVTTATPSGQDSDVVYASVATQADEDDPVSADIGPVIKLSESIICDAVELGASDVHLDPTGHGIDIRFRIDGVMHHHGEVPREYKRNIISRFKLIAGMDIAEKRRPQDGRIRFDVKGEQLDVRVSSVPTAFGENLVLRLLRSKSDGLEISSLNIPEKDLVRINRAITTFGKLILVTGPTGSGKTTTLYTFLGLLNDGTNTIHTVEDPIEYRISGITQIQVNDAIGVTFSQTLRSILRQDPDVIMLGEIRDKETAEIALQAAQTGHLVLSTLHTNSAPAAITRLLNLGVSNAVLGGALGGVLAQRLVRILCKDCKKPASSEYLKKHSAFLVGLDPANLCMPVGCHHCHDTGFKGRVGLYSFLEIDDKIANLIYEGDPFLETTIQSIQPEFTPIEHAAKARLLSGITSVEEIRPYLVEAGVIPTPQVTTSRSSQGSSKPGIKRQKVLLVEDDENTRTVISMVLEREMFEVITAENGQDGLRAIYDDPPDIIISDLMMPVMDGRDLLIKVRQNVATKSIPFIMLTAIDSDEKETALLDIGATDFVSKASSSQVMLSRVRKALNS